MRKLVLLGTTLLLFLLSCQNEAIQNPTIAKSSLQTTAELQTIPTLLQRSKAIQQGKEWESVQNQYAALRMRALKGDKEALLQLAQLFTLEARVTGEHGHYYPAALDLINKGLDTNTEDQDLKFQLLATKAGVLLSQHEFEAALRTAQQAVSLNPHNAQVYGALADAYVELGEYEKAVSATDKMISIRPDLRSYARVSYLREIHGEVDAAIQAMESAVVAGYPGTEETAWTALELGNLYVRYGKTAAARNIYEQILTTRPDYPFAIAAIAELEIADKNYDKAEHLLETAANIIPEVGFYEQMAHIYKATNQEAKLATTLDEIFVMLEDDVNSGHNMNLEYAALHRDLTANYEQALSYALTENKNRPNNIDTNRMLASIYQKQDKLDLAAQHLALATQTNAQYPELKELQLIINN